MEISTIQLASLFHIDFFQIQVQCPCVAVRFGMTSNSTMDKVVGSGTNKSTIDEQTLLKSS